ncbi:MAG: thermonuclease family protein [Pseudomonadota bacterium]
MFLLVLPLQAETLTGAPRIIDADTLELQGTRIRLHGVDAPERFTPDGIAATQALYEMIGGALVVCVGDEEDRYARLIARCLVGDKDLGAALVETGHARAYRRFSTEYVVLENQARDAGLGLWSDKGAADVQACHIKGNISASGRIFHMPGDQFYDHTVIDPAQGERWFCSAEEAVSAGWRAARR